MDLSYYLHTGVLTEDQIRLIDNHLTDLNIEKGISPKTARVRAIYLATFLKEVGDPLHVSPKKIRSVLAAMRDRYKPNTFSIILFLVLRFLTWMHYPYMDEIRKVRHGGKDYVTKTASGMLTVKEVEDIIAATRSSRDRALISLLYEGGFRPIELVRLTWDNVKFDGKGCVISLDSETNKKTGKGRYIRIITYSPALSAWQHDYPGRAVAQSPVFVKLKGKPIPITTTTIRHAVETAAKRAPGRSGSNRITDV